MKTVYVILAFHGHEPLWGLSDALLQNVQDEDLRRTLPDENWIEKRRDAGRDIYSGLLDFASSMGVTVTLEATNELLVQIGSAMPATFSRLKAAYRQGLVYPLYGHAHHTHVALLTDDEVEDEIRLNRDYLHTVMGAPRPRHPGLFPVEDSLDSAKLRGIKNSGIEYVIFPGLDRRKTTYQSDRRFDEKHEPFLIGPDIVALPRHFPVSQYIWRPITKWKVEGLKNQGYILGRYWVLPEEYRKGKHVRFPIGRDEAITEYYGVLKRALAQTPDGGLLLYIQDLELMDFGDVALEIMEAAWRRILDRPPADIRFVTPDEYYEARVRPRLSALTRVRFHQVSWAPEIRLVLRYDGHYPPLEAGRFRGVDAARTVFRRWPLVFWEPGRYIVELTNALMKTFAIGPALTGAGGALLRERYRFEELDPDDRLALHSRLMKRACNWGWFPNEGLQKRPFLHGYLIARGLLERLDAAEARPADGIRLSPGCFHGLEWFLEIVLDTRLAYLSGAIAELAVETGAGLDEASRELDRAVEWREAARRAILRSAVHANRVTATGAPPADLRGLLEAFGEYCRAAFIALDHLQRVWGHSGRPGRLLEKMYDYLFTLYPPLFPSILERTLTENEAAALDRPRLR